MAEETTKQTGGTSPLNKKGSRVWTWTKWAAGVAVLSMIALTVLAVWRGRPAAPAAVADSKSTATEPAAPKATELDVVESPAPAPKPEGVESPAPAPKPEGVESPAPKSGEKLADWEARVRKDRGMPTLEAVGTKGMAAYNK